MTRDRTGDLVETPEAAPVEHDAGCVNGFAGEDPEGLPIPCRRCRPHMAPCPVCGSTRTACNHKILRDGQGCCGSCPHVRSAS